LLTAHRHTCGHAGGNDTDGASVFVDTCVWQDRLYWTEGNTGQHVTEIVIFLTIIYKNMVDRS